MIKVKKNVATFTGKDADNLQELAAILRVTPQKVLIKALE